ncbi:MAG: amino acid adenylation domain-containing protein [Armatimonadota bacterium]
MTATTFLDHLRGRGVELSCSDGALAVRAPRGALGEAERRLLQELKPELLALLREPAGDPPAAPAAPAELEPFPLTDIQEAYWVGRSSLELGNVGCHSYRELDSPTLDLEQLERAWGRLVERHPMLRAVITEDGRQRVLEQVPPYRIHVTDLRSGDPDGALDRIREEMSHRVHEGTTWPLFDVRATQLPDRVRVHVSMDLLIADAASMLRLFQEWGRLYESPEASLPPVRGSFREHVLAGIAAREGSRYQRAARYWAERVPSLPGAPDLPLARGPEEIEKPRFARHSRRLDGGTWSALKQQAAQAGLTPSALLCAIYADVLALWSRGPRFLITLTLFQSPPELAGVVGDFTSTVLLEADGSARTFVDRARALQRRLAEDLEHSAYSGVQVLRDLRSRRGSPVASPVVFTSALGHRQLSGEDFPLKWLGEPAYAITQTPQVWIDHHVYEEEGELVYSWDVVEELFPAGMVAAMFAAYSRILHDLAAAPALDAPAWQGSLARLLPPDQLARRQEANATDAPVSERLLHELFVTQALAHPEREAVVTPSRRLSYGELYARSHALAVELRARGVRPNQLVAVVMEKGWEQAVAVLAILQAGAAYLPLSASLPPARLHALLAHGEVQVALTQPALPLDFPPGLTLLPVSAETPVPPAGTPLPAPLASVQRPEDLAYVIYTSGSTGEPKGVMIDHRGAVNTVLDLNRRLELGPEDRVLGLSSLSFDLSVYDLFGLFAAGGAVVLPGPEARRDPQAWVELVRRERVSLWNSVPALLGMVTAYGEPLGESLRAVLLSGDWIPLPLPEAVRRLAPRAEVWSLGGATEASIWSIYHRIGAVAPEWRSIPYGKPLANQTFHVLNERGEPCPEGVPGELYIGGIGLARGYWRDPERTAERFVEVGGERLYRTGDLGRYLPDGSLEFLGREDLQVKVQGHRIELGELEAALGSHPGVKAAVAAAVGERQGEKRLVAFVVPHSTGDGHTGYVPDSGPGLVTGSAERQAFTLERHGLRRDLRGECIPLEAPTQPVTRPERRTHRRFSRVSVPRAAFDRLLAGLAADSSAGGVLPRCRYPSAGSLYGVQLYLAVREGAVEGIPAGTYYYDPVRSGLAPLSPGAEIPLSAHAAANRETASGAAFSLFLVGKLPAIEPLYGALARDFALLEAGAIAQLLMTDAAELGLGLCPIGTLDFTEAAPLLHLEDGSVFLHALVGGVPAPPGEAVRTGAGPLPEELRSYLSEKLPAYMVPSSIVVLASLPLSANGKVDRSKLRAPEARPAGDRNRPSSGLEAAVSRIVREVVGSEQVGPNDNFFEAGATSLHIVRIHRQLVEELGVELRVVDLFRRPTIAQLAGFLSETAGQGGAASAGQARATARREARQRRGRS